MGTLGWILGHELNHGFFYPGLYIIIAHLINLFETILLFRKLPQRLWKQTPMVERKNDAEFHSHRKVCQEPVWWWDGRRNWLECNIFCLVCLVTFAIPNASCIFNRLVDIKHLSKILPICRPYKLHSRWVSELIMYDNQSSCTAELIYVLKSTQHAN